VAGKSTIATLIGLLAAVPVHAQSTPTPAQAPADGAQQAPDSTAPEPTGSVEPMATITPQPETPAPPPPPAEPQVVVRGGTSATDAALLVGAGAGIAAGACLFLAAHSADDDADAAARYEDYVRISTRADRLRIASAVTAGAGIVLGVLAIYRIKVSKESTQLSFAPHEGGGSLVFERSW
jgi:hypothetical protein